MLDQPTYLSVYPMESARPYPNTIVFQQEVSMLISPPFNLPAHGERVQSPLPSKRASLPERVRRTADDYSSTCSISIGSDFSMLFFREQWLERRPSSSASYEIALRKRARRHSEKFLR